MMLARQVLNFRCLPVCTALLMCGAIIHAPLSFADETNTDPKTKIVVVAPAPPTHDRPIRSQLPNVATPVANHYTQADSVALALAIVPDPLVPRYRRLFDLHVAALELGMLKDGYVLDRFAFPWSKALAHNEDAGQEAKEFTESNLIAGSYGLMIFRCDAWRGDVCNYPVKPSAGAPAVNASTRIRALYIVTETATMGVARSPLECAIRRMEADTGTLSADLPAPLKGVHPCPESGQPPRAGSTATLLSHSLCPAPPAGGHTLVVLGPSFSGSMSSIGETVEGRVTDSKRQVCLVSSAATDSTNSMVAGKYPSLMYQPVALDNESKLAHLAALTEQLSATGTHDVAILAEASTFGNGICRGAMTHDDPYHRLCTQATKFFFPPTIADIAYGLHKQQAQEANDLVNATRQVQSDRHVSLEGGAENGSEFPANESPAVTAASNQLQLDQVMDSLAAVVPKIVIIVATDVRDRLFLFDQLRERLPRAMLVDLEADNLLAHPEFLHASRGAVAMASVNLNSVGSVFPGCRDSEWNTTRASWSMDGQGMLADITAHLYERDMPEPLSSLLCTTEAFGKAPRQAALQLVTFHGLKPVSFAFPDEPPRLGEARRPRFHRLILTEVLAVLFCAALSALWLWPWTLQLTGGRTEAESDDDPARKLYFLRAQKRELYFVAAAVICGALFLPMALRVAHNSTDKIGHPLMYWLVAVELIGLLAAWRCYRQIRSTIWAARHPAYSALWLSVVLGIFSMGFAGAAAWISYYLDRSERLISTVLLNELGFDPNSGLAFYLVAAVAGITTLCASTIVATRTWVVRRNFQLLILARDAAPSTGSDEPASFVPQGKKISESIQTLHGYKPLPVWVTVIVGVFILIIACAPGFLNYLGGPRLTVFGPTAAKVAVLALAATTLCGSILLIAAYGAGRRVNALCGYVRGRILDKQQSKPAAEEIPGLWAGGAEMPNAFPATPVLAIDCAAGSLAKEVWTGKSANGKPNTDDPVSGPVHQAHPMSGAGETGGASWASWASWASILDRGMINIAGTEQAGRAWAAELSKILYQGVTDSRSRFALYALLVSELALFRWIAAGAVLSAFASVGIVFLYPIEADSLLILNLVILALAGLLCAYLAVVFERDGVLSNIVCNRPQKAEISIGLFSFIATPFVALAVAIALIEIPGVVDWAGGLFVMMRTLGVHP